MFKKAFPIIGLAMSGIAMTYKYGVYNGMKKAKKLHQIAKAEEESQIAEEATAVASANTTQSTNPKKMKNVKRHEEYQYLDNMGTILQTGVHRPDRTGTGTLSIFGTFARYSLRGGKIICPTTKRVFLKGVFAELVWMLQGRTDAKWLSEGHGVHIWDGNTSREFLDKAGLEHYEEGDIGAGYGFQWRHYGAKYIDCKTDYTGQGFDQLAELVDQIRKNPTSRRLIMTSWNPVELRNMVLPPCHMMIQFYVANGELSGMVYQRSVDNFLGAPFNLAFYSTLICLVSKMCDLKPGELLHVGGDSHIYVNDDKEKCHYEQVETQLAREPYEFPTLNIIDDIRTIQDVDTKLRPESFEVVGYKSHKAIKAKMSA